MFRVASFPSPAYRPNHLNLLEILNFTGVEKTQEDDIPRWGAALPEQVAASPSLKSILKHFFLGKLIIY